MKPQPLLMKGYMRKLGVQMREKIQLNTHVAYIHTACVSREDVTSYGSAQLAASNFVMFTPPN